MMSDFFDGVEDQLVQDVVADDAASDANDWKPEAGDTLKAVFIKARWIPTKYGDKVIAIVKDTETNEFVNVWLTRTVLNNEFVDAAPAQGKGVAIRYEGERTTKDGSTQFHLYKVRAEESDHKWWSSFMAGGLDLRDVNEAAEATAPVSTFVSPDEAPF